MRDHIDDQHLKLRGDFTAAGTLRRPLLLALGLCLLAGVLLALDMNGLLGPVRSVLMQVFSPVGRPLTQLHSGAADLWADIDELQRLRAENAALRQRQGELEAEVIAYEQALVENQRLRQQLAIQADHPWRLLGAEVALRSPDAGRRVLTIVRGNQDGITPGMAVVGQTPGGPVGLIGIVEETGRATASVLLTTDFGSRISARVLHNGTAALGLVRGQWQRGTQLRLEHVEETSPLVPGAVVVTAGLTGELRFPLPLAAVPPGVPIGEVEILLTEDSIQAAELRPYADPDQVQYVWVILSQAS